MKKFTRLYKDIRKLDHLLDAWEQFLSGKKNRADVIGFQNHLMDNVCDLNRLLEQKTYVHGAYHAFNISDPKPRNIHKATVCDRLLHHLIHFELYPYFDQKFIFDSYSCRVDKGTHKAMNRFTEFSRIVSKNHSRTCWVLECDIRKFFANIDHKILKDILARHIEDDDLQKLLEHIIDSFSTVGRMDVGLPLGNLTSQLFVNIYMNEFDQFMKRTVKAEHYIRYADDFVILHEDRECLSNLIPVIVNFLESKLKLSLHPKKLFLTTFASGIDFLGWVHFPQQRILRTATKRRMFTNLINHKDNRAVVNSYQGLLSHGNGWKLISKLG